MSLTTGDKDMKYPEVGSEIQLVVARKGDVETVAFYKVVEGDGKSKMTLEFIDVRVLRESDIPI